jgi:Lrp/AsnC family transcriptional regulator for asnA, asnC and gidA
MKESKKYVLDDLDWSILNLIKDDGRKPYSEIADALGIAVSTVSLRFNRLLKNNIISIFVSVNPVQAGFNAPATITIAVQPDSFEQAVAEVVDLPEVVFTAMVAGEFNLLIDVNCQDADHLTDFITHKLYKIKGIQDLRVMYQLRILKMAERVMKN